MKEDPAEKGLWRRQRSLVGCLPVVIVLLFVLLLLEGSGVINIYTD